MNETQTKNLKAIEDLGEHQGRLSGPAWLQELRRRAFERFESAQWPTTKEEEWRRTNLAPFEFETYELYPAPVSPLPTPEPETGLLEGRAGLAVYENGSLVRASVRAELAEQGVVFGDLLSITDASDEVARIVRSTLERSFDEADNRVQYWHYAMMASAAVLYVPAKTSIEDPFEIGLSFEGDERVHAPHVIVILERGADVSVIRRIHTAEDGEVLLVDGGEFVVEDGARLRYLNLQRMNDESVYFCNDRCNVGRDGHVHRTEVALGADFVKSRYVSELTGSGADAVLNGIYFPVDEQHTDLRTVQQHRAPHTTSRAFYRGAVRDESHAIYQGLIEVAHEAVGTDAYLTNKNLILTDGARADSIPSLNISTDDVRCSHGSTTGKLDEGQVFYLRSRGYPEVEAKRLLVEGYFEDLILQTPELVHQELRELIMERTPESE
ncbi:MAG: Fe-S cluster assembly protein SufD [Spirochaetota bacterium]